MNNKLFLGTIAISALLSFSGCTPDDLLNEVTSSHDSLNISIINSDTLKVKWEKNYNGYSEVLSRRSGVTSRTGYFLTANTTDDYEIICTISSYAPVEFSCQDTGSGYVSYPRFPDMLEDTVYNIQISEGTEHDYQDVAKSIIYNSSSNSLEFR